METEVRADPMHPRLKITLQRQDGTAGIASVHVTTTLRSRLIEPHMNLAVQTVDYSGMTDQLVVFEDC